MVGRYYIAFFLKNLTTCFEFNRSSQSSIVFMSFLGKNNDRISDLMYNNPTYT